MVPCKRTLSCDDMLSKAGWFLNVHVQRGLSHMLLLVLTIRPIRPFKSLYEVIEGSLKADTRLHRAL